MAGATAKDTVQGLECLLNLGVIHIHQQKTNLGGNKFMVNTPEGQTLLNMKEAGGNTIFVTRAQVREFHMDAVDSWGNTVFTLRRPGVFRTEKVELSINGKLVTRVRKKDTFWRPGYSINDANDTPRLRIKGEITGREFELQTLEKVKIGSISKKYRGFMNEMFSFADDYVITFPKNLDVHFKAAVISACIIIDYRFHEQGPA